MAFARFSICVLLVLVASVAHADDKADAKQHSELGKRHYNLNEWDEAISEFKAAYKLVPDAVDLYNIAQAYRLKGDCVNSSQFYASYQREEKIKKLRDSVTKVRAEMEACAVAPKPVEPISPTPNPTPTPTPVATDPPPMPYPAPTLPTGDNAMRGPSEQTDPNHARRITGKVFLVASGVLTVTGALLFLKGDGLSKDATACDHSLDCALATQLDLEDRSSAAYRDAGFSVGFGATFAVVGIVLLATSSKKSHHAMVMPMRHGAAVGWAF